MAGTNDFKAVATGGGANVITQSAYAALTTFLANGYSAGVVASDQFNKIIRQSSFVSAAVGQFVANAELNALDDGDLSTFVANLTAAIRLLAGTSPGAVIYVAMNTAPSGYLKANGAAISRATYSALFSAIGTTFGSGDGSTTFTLPDLRGEFLRAWDDSRGIDSARVFGSAQSGAIQAHTHDIETSTSTSAGSFDGVSGRVDGLGPAVTRTEKALSTGGTETRPRNIALLACIKY